MYIRCGAPEKSSQIPALLFLGERNTPMPNCQDAEEEATRSDLRQFGAVISKHEVMTEYVWIFVDYSVITLSRYKSN